MEALTKHADSVHVSGKRQISNSMDDDSLDFNVSAAAKAQNAGKLDDALACWWRVKEAFPGDPRGYSGCGAVLRQLQRLDEAEAILTEGILRFPNDEKAAAMRAWVAHSRGDWEEANRRWTNLRRSHPDCFDGYFGGGAVLKALRCFDDADALYRSTFSRFPASPGLLADFAAVAQARGDPLEASRRWISLHTLFPNRLDGLLREAKALREAGLYSEAETVAANAVQRFPGNATAIIEWAQIAQHRNRWSEALHRWETVINEFHVVEGYLGAAQAPNELGRFADAQNVIQPALRMYPNSAKVVSISAWSCHYRGNYSDALIRWKLYREKFPTHNAGYVGGSASLLAMGKAHEATELLETACQVFSQDVHVATQWATVPQHVQNAEEGLRRWRIVFERFPESAPVNAGYALALSKVGNPDEAEKVLQLAMQRGLGSIDVLQAYAECASQRREWSIAEARWRHVVDKFPSRISALTKLGELLRNAGRLEESEDLLTRALERFPDNIELRCHIALTANAKRDWKVALPMWEKLKQSYPRNPGVRSGIIQALWQARQDWGVVSTENAKEAVAFEIPQLLLELDERNDDKGALRDLFMKFESIGDTCEFGIVQRRFDAEPISLLRWTSTQPSRLVMALDTKFEGVGDTEHTIFQVSHGEYTTQDRRYHMFSHTFTPETAEPMEKFAAQHLRRMRYLRKKLIEDLATGEKIFVYKSNQGVSDQDAMAIFQAIRRYGGQPALLCVRLADEGHPPGTVRTMESGLFMGYIDRFSTVDINVDVWVELCKKTDEAWRSTDKKSLAATC